ncbi:MAG: amidinotransferase [Azospirillum sp.]|nr:amidinotransferase [Azospirillum sp.]
MSEPRLPVGSHTEWDPLEEVIVGRVDGAAWPDWNLVDRVTVSEATRRDVLGLRGHWRRYPEEVIAAARGCLDEFITILDGEGVRVRRPEPYPFDRPYETPHWRVANGFCSANPRDVILPIGTTFLECPMAHRGRQFEQFAYRPLMKEMMARGALWLAAPRPELREALYDPDYRYPEGVAEDLDDDWSTVDPDQLPFVTTEFEPVFDAADFTRCGRDIFGQRSQITNHAGIEWLRRFLGPDYRLHLIPTRCAGAYHIDTTFVPLAPGKVLVNPNWVDVDRLPPALKRWEILQAPPPRTTPVDLAGWMSDWISINVLSLDEKRIVVERDQVDLIRSLKEWGFEPIPCTFKYHYPFLGSFHCATLDIYRRGELADYR